MPSSPPARTNSVEFMTSNISTVQVGDSEALRAIEGSVKMSLSGDGFPAQHFEKESLRTSSSQLERGHIRASEGSVRHVEVSRMEGVGTSSLGSPRPLSSHRRADNPGDRRATPSTMKGPISRTCLTMQHAFS